MNSKYIILTLLMGIMLFLTADAQHSARDFFGDYLVRVHEFDSAVFHQKKVHGKIETTTNFYIDSLGAFNLGTTKLLLYKFGSYSDHVRPHFALMKADNFNENCIVDCQGIADDLDKILSYLKRYSSSFKETENVKLKVIRRFVKDYPDFY